MVQYQPPTGESPEEVRSRLLATAARLDEKPVSFDDIRAAIMELVSAEPVNTNEAGRAYFLKTELSADEAAILDKILKQFYEEARANSRVGKVEVLIPGQEPIPTRQVTRALNDFKENQQRLNGGLL